MSRPPLPLVFQTEQIVPVMESVIAKFQNMHQTMIENVTPSTACFANTFKPWACVSNETESDTGMIELLSYAAADQDTKDAAYKAQRLFSSASAAWMGRSDIFTLLKAAANRNEELDPESRHWVDAKLQDYVNSGHGSLDESAVHIYIEQRAKIERLKERYNRNLMAESGGLWIDEPELSGVPAEELQKWKKGSGTNEDKYFVPFTNGGPKIISSYADNENTRKMMFLAEEARLVENADLLQEIVHLRDSQARLLGYASHAAFRINSRAIKSVKQVEHLLSCLKESLVPCGRQELQQLQNLRDETVKKRGNRQCEGEQLPPWDLHYYQRLSSLEALVDEETISEYFPLGPTVMSMLRIFESVLMLRFVQIPPDQLDSTSRWHESVEVWEAWDSASNEFMGFLYFDLLWREHKYRGSQNVNIHCFLRDDGTRKVPATTLMCCFSKPSESSCALLKHKEVVTLFHELGHAIHDLVSKTKHVRFHGTRLPVDFGEMPSILLENWCWMEDTLVQLSCHYTTLDPSNLATWRGRHVGAPDPPAKIPADLVKSLVKTRYLNRGLYHLHQLAVSFYDLKIHNPPTHEDALGLDLQQLWYDIREEIEGMDFTPSRENGHEHVTFGHLLNGYDVGYYAYLSCTSMAQDIFQAFFAHDPWKSPRRRPRWHRRRLYHVWRGISSTKTRLQKFPPAGLLARYRGKVLAIAFAFSITGLALKILLFPSPKVLPEACTSPAVRREWRQLNSTEKRNYIDAVKCLQTFPSRLTGIGRHSDDFPWLHRQVAKSIHDTAMFLPYHRYLLHLYEKSLRELCQYSGVLTYWDWGLDWQDPTKSAIWDPVDGFGGDGNPAGKLTVGWGSCVTDGPFADYEVLFYNMIPRLHCLSRGFGRCFGQPWTGDAFKPAAVQHVMNQKTFADFSAAIESGPHAAVPDNVCGDFFYLEAPNDPVFFLHHANLDRLWRNWQEGGEKDRTWEYNGRAHAADNFESASLDEKLSMHGLGPDVTIRQVMDTKSGIFCYKYEQAEVAPRTS